MRKPIVTEFVSLDGVIRAKYVVSSTLRSSDWHDTTITSGDVEDAVAQLKATDGDPILVAGSRTLVGSLLAAGLVDELNLQVFPLTLPAD